MTIFTMYIEMSAFVNYQPKAEDVQLYVLCVSFLTMMTT